MSKAKQVFLILVVVVVLTIVAVLGITSRNTPIIQEQFQYSEEQASERLETLKAAQKKHEIEIVPMKFFTEEIHPDTGEFTVTAITTMRVEDIAAVSFRAVNSAVPSVEKWYDAKNEGNGRYRLSGTAEELGGRSGTYTIEAFITPAGGGETKAGETQIEMELANYYYTEAIGEGKQLLVLVGPKADIDKEITGVLFKVWSVDDDQDDIKSYTAKEDPEGVWTAEIDVHDFADKGDFIANAYALFADGEVKTASTSEATTSEAKEEATSASTSETKDEATSTSISGATTSESKAEATSASTSEATTSEAIEEAGSASTSEAKEEAASASTSEAKEEAGSASTSEVKDEAASASTSEAKEGAASASTSEAKEEATSASTSEASTSEAKEETASASTSEASTSEASTSEAKEESTSASTSEAKEEEKAATGETEIGIASERFELLPEPMDLPEGAGEVVTEGKRVYVKDVPELIQTPELPTGCESVALTIVLRSMGFELEKTDIAKNYLAMGTDMATSYVGDPFSKNGAGCFPPAIVNAANKYLEEKKDKRTAHNITGESIDDLREYIDNGLPVILWSSMYMADPAKSGGSYTYQGQTYQWYRSEHCVVLYGYDKGKDVYLVSDPLNGYVERDASAFKNIYDSIGKYAVVIY